MPALDSTLEEVIEFMDRGLIGVSLMIISRQLGSNGSTSSSVLKRKRKKKPKHTSSEKINHFELIYRILPRHKNVNY